MQKSFTGSILAFIGISAPVVGLTSMLTCATADAPVAPAAVVDDAGGGAVTLAGRPVRFLSAPEAAEFLGRPDAFTDALSDFDRSFRMRTREPVDDATFRAFVAAEAMGFTDDERERWGQVIRAVDARISTLDLPLPDEVLLIRTSGKEELGAGGYTRGHAIIVAAAGNRAPKDAASIGLLAHELFHVISRASPAFRDRMYSLVGFSRCDTGDVPAALERVRVTNPDAHARSHCASVTSGGVTRSMWPVLSIASSLDEALALDNWFKALRITLLPAAGDDDGPWNVDDTDFNERLSRNTGYSIHAEEMLADNFALFVKQVPAADLKDTAFMDTFVAALAGQEAPPTPFPISPPPASPTQPPQPSQPSQPSQSPQG